MSFVGEDVPVPEESLAGMMVEGVGRSTGRPAVVLAQGAWVLANAAMGALEALTGAAPIVYLTDVSDKTDVTLMHEVLGRTQVHWKDGFRRMVAATYPDIELNMVDLGAGAAPNARHLLRRTGVRSNQSNRDVGGMVWYRLASTGLSASVPAG